MNLSEFNKYRRIVAIYILYTSFLFFKSLVFTINGMKWQDYLINYEDEGYIIMQLMPFYLLLITNVLSDDNFYHNHRYMYRKDVMIQQIHKVIKHTLIFGILDFLVCILLVGGIFGIFSSYPLHSFIWILIVRLQGFFLAGNVLILGRQYVRDHAISFFYVYAFMLLECFIFYNNLLPWNIPIFFSWIISTNNNILKVLALFVINSLVYRFSYNHSFQRDFW